MATIPVSLRPRSGGDPALALGVAKLSARLLTLANAEHVEPYVFALAKGIKADIRRQFQVGGDPSWAPLRPNTVAGKKFFHKPSATLGGIRGGLFRSGSAAKGIAVAVERTVVGKEWRISVLASKIARFHQEGRTGPWTITAKRAAYLSFPIAASYTGARSSLKSRKVSKATAKVGWAKKKSVQHPGYPARPFVRVTPALVKREFTVPLQASLKP